MKTTLEKAREEKHDNTINVLQSIIEKNYDAEKGYKNAMEHAKNPELKQFLKQQAVKRSRFATEIDHEIRQLGESPKESGSITGSLHRSWMNLKSGFSNDTDEAILEEVITGEKASVDDYQDALKDSLIKPELNSLLNSQLTEIQSTLNNVKTMEDIRD